MTRCEQCGADDWLAQRPDLGPAVVTWLQGGGPWRPVTLICRSCGARQSRSSTSVLRRVPRSPLGLPGRLVTQVVRVLHRERRAEPAPWLYVASLAGGAAVGAGAARVTRSGQPWSGAAVGAGSGALVCWAVFARTALGPGLTDELADAVLREVAPDRARERHRARTERLLRSAAFPLYGLPPGWSGPRSRGGYSAAGRPPVVTAVTLGHGEPGSGPELLVTTAAELVDVYGLEPVEGWLAAELGRNAALEAPSRPGRRASRTRRPAGRPPTGPPPPPLRCRGRHARSAWTAGRSRFGCARSGSAGWRTARSTGSG